MGKPRSTQTRRGARGARLCMRLSAALALGLALGACTPILRDHGYIPDEESVAALKVGLSTRGEVAEQLGQPSAQGMLGERAWIYHSSRWRTVTFRAPELISREVLALGFDEGGTLRAVARLDAEDGRALRLNRRVTEDNVAGVSFLRQLLGNVGNFSPAEMMAD